MVGPVIQVAGRLDSEDGLRTGNLCEVESAFIGRGVVLPWAERAQASTDFSSDDSKSRVGPLQFFR